MRRRRNVASLFNKVAQFGSSRKGRQLTEKGKQLAKDPETRRKLEELRGRAGRKR